MERTRRFKLAWLAFALFQLALPSWSVIADARTLGPLPSGEVHVEADACTPSHPLDCRLCSFIRTAADLPDGLPELPLPTMAAGCSLPAAPALAAVAPTRSPLPRAPPLGS